MINSDIKIYIITYQRPHLLRRAIESIISQSHTNWVAEVINDDPDDKEVIQLINEFSDHRISLSTPIMKRGGTANFNYAFKNSVEPFATILEDDNWYEPDFLKLMLNALTENDKIQIAVANEKIWIENSDSSWTDSHKTIWPEVSGTTLYTYQLKDKCGSAKICNSSMLWRTDEAKKWLTPSDIPIDVTEHFRERVMSHPILLVNIPLVNFAQTLQTNRSTRKLLWGSYQTLLISSIFVNLNKIEADELADKLWLDARNNHPQYKTSLLHSGLSHTNAFVLLKKATIIELIKYCLTRIRHPIECYKIIKAPKSLSNHFAFLVDSIRLKKTA